MNEQMRKTRKRAFKRVWGTFFPFIPLLTHLPFGGWWLSWNDATGDAIFCGSSSFLQIPQVAFVWRFLQPGMNVLDVGAHHGAYTLLASRKVGPQGRVIAFEPSPRERRKLFWHLRLNQCSNVTVESFALADREGQMPLYVVEGKQTGCNSLRPPNISEPANPIPVSVMAIDTYLHRSKIDRVHFVKLDIEGAELDFLKGAQELLHRYPRPVIFCEVQDVRTRAWGYRAKEVVTMLRNLGFIWFKPSLGGILEAISMNQEDFEDNLVAIPAETVKSEDNLRVLGL